MLADGRRVENDRRDHPDDAEALLAFASSRDQTARAELCARFDWLAINAARRFRDRGESNDDLVQVARLGLLKAIDRFNPDLGTPFAAYAIVTMLGELRRHFRDVTWRVHVPRRVKDQQTSLRSAVEALTHELGRPPTPAELARRLGISEDLVLESLDGAAAYSTASLDAVWPGRVIPTADRLVSTELSTDVQVEVRQVLAQLPERERRIVELRYFDGLSQSEIAEEIGISQVHVSRLLRSTLMRLRTNLAE